MATGVVLGVAALGFYRFNFTDGGDILPGINVPGGKALPGWLSGRSQRAALRVRSVSGGVETG